MILKKKVCMQISTKYKEKINRIPKIWESQQIYHYMRVSKQCSLIGKLNKKDPKLYHAHPLSHSTSLILKNNNSSSSCALLEFFWKLIKMGHGGPTCQLVTHPPKQTPSHPPDQFI
jgi:hypothetical protein